MVCITHTKNNSNNNKAQTLNRQIHRFIVVSLTKSIFMILFNLTLVSLQVIF